MTLLRRHGRWLIVAALAGIVGALLFYAARPTTYASTAQVDVESNTSTTGVPLVVPNMATEVQVATSGVVLGTTASAFHETPSKMTGHLSAKTSGTGNVLSISCKMPTAAAAQHCAATAAASYVAFRDQVTSSATSQAHNPLNVTLVTPASLPTAAAGPGKKILLPIGAILGLMLGIGAIFARDHFDGRVRDGADLERCLDAPVLGGIPHLRPGGGDPAHVFSQKPLSKAAEAYRYLRSHLQFLADSASDGAIVLLVASPQRGEGRTCVAANVATALAHANSSVILVDADLRRPSLAKVFGVAERPGLSDLIAGSTSRDEVAVPTSLPGLRLVTAGKAPAVAADVFDPERLTRAFYKMRAIANFIVVDSPPLLVASDAIILARASDIVMVVADVRRTERASAIAAAQEIRATGPRTIVGVLNDVSSPKNGEGLRTVNLEPHAPARYSDVPATLVGIVPPRSANGQGQHESLTRLRTDTEE